MESLAPDSYAQFLAGLKSRIQAAQLRAALAVNRELVLLYWQIGRYVLDRQERESWGAKVIDHPAATTRLSLGTVKVYLSTRIYPKLGIHSRTELIARY